MVVSLDYFNRGSTPSPSSPGALGLRPSRPDSMLVPTCGPTTPKETRQPLQTLHASNKTPLTAVKDCCEDEEHEPASAGLSPSSLAQRLFYVFCDEMGLLDDNTAQEGAISPGDSAFQETVTQDMIAATSAQGQQSLWGGAAPSPAFPGFSGTSPDDRAGPLAVSAATNASVGKLVASQEGKKERAGAAARPGAPVGAKSALPVAGAATRTRSKRVAWRDPLSVPDAGGEGAADAGRLGTVGTPPSGAAAEEAAASPAAKKRKRIQTEFTREEALVAFADASKWDEVGAGPLYPHKKNGCKNCGTNKTPQWRCGPGGLRTLCNACGVRWKEDNLTAQAAAAAWPQLPQR